MCVCVMTSISTIPVKINAPWYDHDGNNNTYYDISSMVLCDIVLAIVIG